MAAGKFKLNDGERVRLTRCAIETATAIEAGDLVTMASGYITKAAAASAAVAWCPDGHAANSGTSVEVTLGNDFTLVGTGDAAFAITQKGTEVDITDTNQYVDVGASSTDVLKISIGEDAGVATEAAGITVRINKPLF